MLRRLRHQHLATVSTSAPDARDEFSARPPGVALRVNEVFALGVTKDQPLRAFGSAAGTEARVSSRRGVLGGLDFNLRAAAPGDFSRPAPQFSIHAARWSGRSSGRSVVGGATVGFQHSTNVGCFTPSTKASAQPPSGPTTPSNRTWLPENGKVIVAPAWSADRNEPAWRLAIFIVAHFPANTNEARCRDLLRIITQHLDVSASIVAHRDDPIAV